MKVWTYWICPSCDSMIQGKHRECPNCATPVPEDAKYLMPDDPRVIDALAKGKVILNTENVNVDEKGIKAEVVAKEEERTGPNWICSYCGAQNYSDSNTCAGCGSPRSEKIYQTEPKPAPTQSRLTPIDRPVLPQPSGNRNKLLKPVLAILGVLFLLWLFLPVTRKATVQSFRWERSIEIEKYTLCHEDDWSVPPGGKMTGSRQEIHHYDHVLDHYETKTRQVSERVLDGYDTSYKDLGNGQAEMVQTPRYRTEYHTETYQDPVYVDVPVYQTKYYYDIGRWKHAYDLETGGGDQNPYWHETDIPQSVSNPDYDDLKQGTRTEHYYVQLKKPDGKFYEASVNYSEWSHLKVGDRLTYKSFRFSKNPISELEIE